MYVVSTPLSVLSEVNDRIKEYLADNTAETGPIGSGGTTPRNPRHMGSMDGGRVCRTVFDARILFSGHLY